MCYPGLDSLTKAHLWRSICSPCLLYGTDSMFISETDFKKLESTQGTYVKKSLGLSKRSHHSNVLLALNIRKTKEIVMQNVLSLYNRMFKCDTPVSTLNCALLSQYFMKQKLVKGTILCAIVSAGFSPIDIAFSQKKVNVSSHGDGVVDSLQYLLCHENYVKPYSVHHLLTQLLTKSF